ncbi:MAG TPA: GntR family transcriptional regulator [Sphingomonadaceae bacterium]|nr:GntR family transcriptional regulator [Sphingomonadaceae bacterium]
MRNEPSRVASVSPALGTPLHRQVFLVLRDRIISRLYMVGDALPSEEELARQFQVSRTTLRYALSELERAGLITRRHGVGTFVAHQGNTELIHAPISEMISQTEEIGRATEIRLVEASRAHAPRHIQELFRGPDDELFHRAIRLRTLKSGQPILFVKSFVPVRLIPAINYKDLRKKSLYDVLAGHGVVMASGSQTISATLADPIIANLLEIDIGSPLIRMNRHFRDRQKDPLYAVEILANPTFFQLQMELDSIS